MRYLKYTGNLDEDERVEDFQKDVAYFNKKIPLLEETDKEWKLKSKNNKCGYWFIPKLPYNLDVFEPCSLYEITIEDELFEI